MFSQAVGILLSRLTMRSSPIPALSSAIIRLLFGILLLLVLILIQKRSLLRYKFESKNNFNLFLLAVFFGTFITMWLQQNTLRFLEAGIAQTLLSTSPIFIAVIQIFSGNKVQIQDNLRDSPFRDWRFYVIFIGMIINFSVLPKPNQLSQFENLRLTVPNNFSKEEVA